MKTSPSKQIYTQNETKHLLEKVNYQHSDKKDQNIQKKLPQTHSACLSQTPPSCSSAQPPNRTFSDKKDEEEKEERVIKVLIQENSITV